MTGKIPVCELKKLLKYESETGCLYWVERPLSMFNSEWAFKVWNKRFANKLAYSEDGIGYLRVSIYGKRIKAHIVCWALFHGRWPDKTIDHINHIGSDNRISNLRLATRSQQQAHRRKQSNNTSGTTGVRWHGQRQKWNARIEFEGRKISLGLFKNKEDAIKSRKEAEEKYFEKFSYKETA